MFSPKDNHIALTLFSNATSRKPRAGESGFSSCHARYPIPIGSGDRGGRLRRERARAISDSSLVMLS